MDGPFTGKRALVLGVANKRSIAWAIAQALADGGARLAFTYQGERIEKSVRDLAATVDTALVTECDVRSDEDLARVFGEVGDAFGGGLDSGITPARTLGSVRSPSVRCTGTGWAAAGRTVTSAAEQARSGTTRRN